MSQLFACSRETESDGNSSGSQKTTALSQSVQQFGQSCDRSTTNGAKTQLSNTSEEYSEDFEESNDS